MTVRRPRLAAALTAGGTRTAPLGVPRWNSRTVPRSGPSTRTSRSRPPAARTVSQRASPTRRSMDESLRAGQVVRPFEQLATLLDQLVRLLFTDGRTAELRPLQQVDHLRGQRIAIVGQRSQLVLELGVGPILARVTTLNCSGRCRQRRQAELSDRGVELLVDAGDLCEAALAGGAGPCPSGDILSEGAAIVAVVVLQSEQHHQGRSDVGVIRH